MIFHTPVKPPVEVQYTVPTTILGTDGVTIEGLSRAFEIGYRLIDTAMVYGSHEKINQAMINSGHVREEFFIATKIPGSKLKIEEIAISTEKAVDQCLEELGVEYLDMVYLHGPDAFQSEVLEVLSEFKNQQKIRHIALSNVTVEQIAAISTIFNISAVQVEFNPYSWDEKLLQYCQDKKIDLVGYRPFRQDESHLLLSDSTLVAIAARINVSVSELILGWVRQKGVLPIAKANSEGHLRDNIRPLNRDLTDDEMKEIDGLNRNTPSCLWQQYSDKDLLNRSEGWITSLRS